MQTEIQVKFNEIDNTLKILKKHFNWDASIIRIKELDQIIKDENFWNDASTAQGIMREKSKLKK